MLGEVDTDVEGDEDGDVDGLVDGDVEGVVDGDVVAVVSQNGTSRHPSRTAFSIAPDNATNSLMPLGARKMRLLLWPVYSSSSLDSALPKPSPKTDTPAWLNAVKAAGMFIASRLEVRPSVSSTMIGVALTVTFPLLTLRPLAARKSTAANIAVAVKVMPDDWLIPSMSSRTTSSR